MRSTPATLQRALRYPYDCPYRPFVVTGGTFRRAEIAPWPPRDDINAVAALLRDRTPSLAVGSNRSPRQLARKFADFPHPLSIPVWPVRVQGIDAVYTASIGHYGAIPATAHPEETASAALMLVWLTPEEWVRMDQTEGLGIAYDRWQMAFEAEPGALPSAAHGVRLPAGVESIGVYVHRAGPLWRNGGPVRIAEIPRNGAPGGSLGWRMTQGQVQRWMRDRLAPEERLRAFISGNIANAALRERRVDRLKAYAYPRWRPSNAMSAAPPGDPPVSRHPDKCPARLRLLPMPVQRPFA